MRRSLYLLGVYQQKQVVVDVKKGFTSRKESKSIYVRKMGYPEGERRRFDIYIYKDSKIQKPRNPNQTKGSRYHDSWHTGGRDNESALQNFTNLYKSLLDFRPAIG